MAYMTDRSGVEYLKLYRRGICLLEKTKDDEVVDEDGFIFKQTNLDALRNAVK